MKYEIKSHVENGKLNRNKPLIQDAIKSLEGKEVVITIEKAKKKRSNQQNAFYWGICLPIVRNCLKEAGNNFSIKDVHEILKLKFLKEVVLVDENTGECIERVKSTTQLGTADFMYYIAEIQKMCNEWFGVVIPEPNTQLTIE